VNSRMKIGGTLRYRSNLYYISQEETKSKVNWFLISEIHKDDRARAILDEQKEHRILDSAFVRTKPVPVDYVVEAIDKGKVSGKLGVFRSKLILNEVLETLASAVAYSFSREDVIENETFNTAGVIGRDFEARDDKLHLRYSKRNNYYTRLYVKYEGMELTLDEDYNIKVEHAKQIKYDQIKEKKSGRVILNTIKALDYEALRQVLDLDWYEKDGVLLKDYRSVETIQEFEELVIDEMMKELELCKSQGKQLILGLDTETTGFIFADLSPTNEERDEMVAIPIAWRDNQSIVVFTNMEWFGNVPIDYVIDRLRYFISENSGHVKIEKRGNFRSAGNGDMSKMTTFGATVPADEEDAIISDVVGHYEFDREDINLVGHNIMFDGRVFYAYGLQTYWNNDTLQMAFNLNPKVAKGSNKLKNITRRIFGHETPELSDILGKGNEDKYRYIPDKRVATIYGCADTDYTRLVFKHLYRLMSAEMYKQYQKQDIRIMNVLYMSEYYGLTADEELLKKRSEIVWNDLEAIKKFLYNFVGIAVDHRNKSNVVNKEYEAGLINEEQMKQRITSIRVNPGEIYEFDITGNEVRDVLYNILGYPKKAWTKGAKPMPSVDKFAMKKLQSAKWPAPKKTLKDDLLSTDPANETLPAGKKVVLIEAEEFNKLKYPIAYVLSKYAELNKEWTSYYKPIKEQNLEGKIFKGYSLARIETRRIMNPGQTMKGDLKALIKPYNDDYYLFDFDQSQVEYRIMGSIAKFVEIIKKMSDPEKDYHIESSSLVYAMPAHKVTKKIRKQVKGLSFGIPYGLGDHKMSENLFGKSDDDALYETRKLLHVYKKANRPIMEMLDTYKQQAIEPIELSEEMRKFITLKEDEPTDTPYGKVTGLLGFYRMFDLSNMDNKKKGSIQRPAGNYPIQNFAAELFRIILMRFYDRCVAEGIAHLIKWHMLIHDELLGSAHKSIHPFFLFKIIKETCVITIEGHTKYFVGINIGYTWAEVKLDENEAPMMFVDRIIKQWDAGEYRNDDYNNTVWTYTNAKGKTITETGVKAYVLKHKREYIIARIGEVLRTVQPDIDTGLINIPHILEHFTNYIVRSYVSEFLPVNGEVFDWENDDEVWISRFETWILEVYGEGREAKYPDGTIKSIQQKSAVLITLDDAPDDDTIVLEEDYWTFDSEEIGDGQTSIYGSFAEEADEDEEAEFYNQFNLDNSDAKNVSDLILEKSPTYSNVKLLNSQLMITVKRTKDAAKVKQFLANHEDKDGNQVLFVTPLGRDRWSSRVSKNVKLDELDSFVEGLA
jgi:DNA polymerase I-like protein with 3'-5' exonuclease and polymerase domains